MTIEPQAKLIEYIRDLCGGAEPMREWMETPNPAFGDMRPCDMVGTCDEELLWMMVHQIHAGVAN